MAVFFALAAGAGAQTLRFSNHRKIEPPEYATVRIGPFYSNIDFSQSAGYRYTRSRGRGTDFLYGNDRGVIKEDGSEFPIVSRLNFRNYIILTDNADLDVSVGVSYSYFPNDTQENELNVDLAEEGITGSLSTEFRPARTVRGTLYDNVFYHTDYVDTRGITDEYGGAKYERLDNTVGLNVDWMVNPRGNAVFRAARNDLIPKEKEFDDQERFTYTESAGYQHKLSDFLICGAEAGFRQNMYAVTNRADSSDQSYTVSADARLTSRTTGSASAGYNISSVSSPGGDSRETGDSTAVGSLSVETELSPALRHGLSYGRTRRQGFRSAYEIADTWNYRLDWRGRFSEAGFYSRYITVDPSRTDINEFSNWSAGLNTSHPIARGITLDFNTSYTLRLNSGTYTAGDIDEEWKYDYATWVSRLGTSFALLENVSFSTYFQHIERDSDSENLSYTRDIFSATFTYTHAF
ncbi:MAG: hypothetical protein R6V03_03545 [Kiritimatiellia bacterium]